MESPLRRIPHSNRIPRFFEQKPILASLISKTEKQQKQVCVTKI